MILVRWKHLDFVTDPFLPVLMMNACYTFGRWLENRRQITGADVLLVRLGKTNYCKNATQPGGIIRYKVLFNSFLTCQ